MNTLVELPKYATVIEINNPFNPRDLNRKSLIISGQTIEELCPEIYSEYVAVVNGDVLYQDSFNDRVIQENDYVVFSPVPQGGEGGGKSVLRIAALVALTYFTYGAATSSGTLLSITGATQGTMGTMALQGVTLAAGSMLINSVIPVQQNVPALESSLEGSPSYGIDGPKNSSDEGIVVPVVYGNYRVGGNLIDIKVDNNFDQVQELTMRFVISEGPIAAVPFDDLQINDRPISDFIGEDSRPELEFKSGEANQDLSTLIKGASQSVSVAATLTTDYTTYTTSLPIDAFRFDILLPESFRSINNEGKSEPIVEPITIQYRLLGETEWIDLLANSLTTEYQVTYVYERTAWGYKWPTPVYSSTKISGGWHNYEYPSDGRIIGVHTSPGFKDRPGIVTRRTCGYVLKAKPLADEPLQIRGKYLNATRFSFESGKLPSGTYEIRAKRDTAESASSTYLDRIDWADLVEIQDEDLSYPNTAYAVVKIKLDEKLNSLPKVTFGVSGRVIRSIVAESVDENGPTKTAEYNEIEQASNNPAWVALDMITNDRYGAGEPDSSIDFEAWIDWANFCYVNELEFNGQFDTSMSVWDALQHVFSAGRAQMVNIGTKYSVIVERADYPRMMFSVANIIKGSFQMSWLPISERANEIEVTYFDEDDNYLPNTLRIVDSEVPGSASEQRKAELTLYGITSKDRAVADAKLLLNMNKYILLSATLKAPIESITSTIGDVVYVQHDIPQWGFGGRLEANSIDASSGFVLDKEVTVESGKNYEFLIQHDFLSLGSFVIDAVISGRYVRLNAFNLPFDPISRAIINGVEYKIVDRFEDDIGTGIVTQETLPSGLVGMSCEIFDTDVIETRPLTSATLGGAGDYSTLNVDTPFSNSATQGSKFMFGEVEKVKKPFRIQSISGGSELTRQISLIEYNEAIYNESADFVPAPNYSSLGRYIDHVSNLQIAREVEVLGSVYTPIVTVSWDMPSDDRYRGADISVRETNGQWISSGVVNKGKNEFTYRNGAVGQNLEFRVTAIDAVGGRAPFQTAPTISILIDSNVAPVPIASNLLVRSTGRVINLTWQNPTYSTYKETQVFRGTVDDFQDVNTVRIHSITGESFEDVTTVSGTQYFYWVVVSNTEGVLSEPNQVAGTTLSLPETPTSLGLVTSFIGASAKIAWDFDPSIINYSVEVTTDSVVRRTTTINASNYEYGIEQMNNDGNVSRSVLFKVTAVNQFGMVSTSADLTVSNTAPALPTALSMLPGFKLISVEFVKPTDIDYVETRVWVSTTTGFARSAANLIASSSASPIVINNLDDDQTYYIRLATYDQFGEGAVSSEFAVTTLEANIPGLSPWATVTDADRAFIDANLGNDSIASEKIDKLVASKIITGTLAATEAISVEGTVEAVTGAYNVTLGPKDISGSIALFSFLFGTTPIVAMYEDGTAEFTGKITIGSGSGGYGNFIDKPTSLADVNSGEGSKLSGITTGADVTDYEDDRVNNNNATPYTLIKTANMQVNGSKVTCLSGSDWVNSVRSVESYTSGAFVSFRITANNLRLMIGLNADPETDDSYTSLDYSIYINSTGEFQVRHDGANVTTGGTPCVAGDVFTIAYDGANVIFYHNGVIVWTIATNPDLKLYLDSSFRDTNATIEALGFGPFAQAPNWLTNVANRPNDSQILNNLIDLSGWDVGAVMPPVGWQLGGSPSENEFINSPGPNGTNTVVWRATEQDDTTTTDGGFYTPSLQISHAKAARLSVWVRRSTSTSGATKFLVDVTGGGGVIDPPTFGVTTEGTFWESDLPNANQWYLLVGFILSSGELDFQYTGDSGVYEKSSGARVLGATQDFRFGATTESIRLGIFHNDSAGWQEFLNPRIDIITGEEPSIQELLLSGGPISLPYVEGAGDLAGKDAVEWDSADMLNIPDEIKGTATEGLNLTPTYMGHFDGTDFTSYIDASGNVFFGDALGHYFSWDVGIGVLQIRGEIQAEDIVSGGTITGSTYRTNDSGGERLEIQHGTNSLTAYWEGGAGGALGKFVDIGASATDPTTSDKYAGIIGGYGLQHKALLAVSDTETAATLHSNSGAGAFVDSNTGFGLIANSDGRPAIHIQSRRGINRFNGIWPCLMDINDSVPTGELVKTLGTITTLGPEDYYCIEVQPVTVSSDFDVLGVAASTVLLTAEICEENSWYDTSGDPLSDTYSATHRVVYVYIAGIVPAQVSGVAGAVSPGDRVVSHSSGLMQKTASHTGSAIIGVAQGSVPAGAGNFATVPILLRGN